MTMVSRLGYDYAPQDFCAMRYNFKQECHLMRYSIYIRESFTLYRGKYSL